LSSPSPNAHLCVQTAVIDTFCPDTYSIEHGNAAAYPFVGDVVEQVGPDLTHNTLQLEANLTDTWSHICSANSPNDPNLRLEPSDGEGIAPPTVFEPRSDNFKTIVYYNYYVSDDSKLLAHSKETTSRTFLLATSKEEVVCDVEIIQLDVMARNETMERPGTDGENPNVWRFQRTLGRYVPLCPDLHSNSMKSNRNVTMRLEDGETTPATLSIVGTDDPVNGTIYSIDKDILNTLCLKDLTSLQKDRLFYTMSPNLTIGWKNGETAPAALSIAGAGDLETHGVYNRINFLKIITLGKRLPIPKDFQKIVAVRKSDEQMMDLRHSLRCLDVPIERHSCMIDDNESIVTSSSRSEAKLHNRHALMSFKCAMEAVVYNTLPIMCTNGSTKPTNVLGKRWFYQRTWPFLHNYYSRMVTPLLEVQSSSGHLVWGVTEF